MNCTCIANIEKALIEKYTKELGVPVTADCMSSGMGMSDKTLVVIHKTDFRVEGEAKGFRKGKLLPVLASFCPFCGTPTGMKKDA